MNNNTLHFFIKDNGKLYVIPEIPEEPYFLYPNGSGLLNDAIKSEWNEYNKALQQAKGNAIEVLNEDEVKRKLTEWSKGWADVEIDFDNISDTNKIYSLEGCNILMDECIGVCKAHLKGKELCNSNCKLKETALITFEESKKNKSLIDKVLSEVPLITKLKVNNEIALIELLTEMGYRENKTWSNDENEKLSILVRRAEELSKSQIEILEQYKAALKAEIEKELEIWSEIHHKNYKEGLRVAKRMIDEVTSV